MKKISKPNLSLAYIANIAFFLGVLSFAASLYVKEAYTPTGLIPFILTYALLLLNAVISLKPTFAGKWTLTKGIVASACCFLTTPYLKFIATLYAGIYTGTSALFNAAIIVLHAITVLVILLPILSMIRKALTKKTVPIENTPAHKHKILKRTIAAALLLFAAFLLAIITPLITAKPITSVDYLTQYNKLTKPANYDPNENAVPYYKKTFESLVEKPLFSAEFRWTVLLEDANQTELNIINDWHTANAQAFAHLKTAAQKPYYWVEHHAENNSIEKVVDYSIVSNFRQSLDYLDFEARLKVSRGQIKDALETMIDIQKISRHLLDTKLSIHELCVEMSTAALCRTALKILDTNQFDPAAMTKFQNQLQQHLHSIANNLVYDTEKLRSYDIIQRVFADDGTGDGRLIPGPYLDLYGLPQLRPRLYPATIWMALVNPGKKQTIELTTKLYELLDELNHKTPWQLHQKDTSHDEQILKLTHTNGYVWRQAKYSGSRCIRRQQHICRIKALITSIALARYKADKSQFPENLDQLVSNNYLEKLPHDPYSNGPLTYKKTDNNYKLYSLGADFDDDNGTQSNWGRYEKGGDQLFWPINIK